MRSVPKQPDLFGGSAPYQPHSETSLAAAIQILPKAGTARRAVYDYIRAHGEFGATDDEVQMALMMDPSTERPRRVELWEQMLIRQKPDSYRPTRSGRLAVIWVLTDLGKQG